MKVLYFGGQKSGKSSLAEQKALQLSSTKPYYIATYDNSFDDSEMHKRLLTHQERREANFITIEESLHLDLVIEEGETYLIDCLSMWILNIIESETQFEEILERILDKNANIIFVLNDVTRGIIPENKLSRTYIDLSGIIGQKVASLCDEVYEVVFGIEKRIK